jgi:hypothetical protein
MVDDDDGMIVLLMTYVWPQVEEANSWFNNL